MAWGRISFLVLFVLLSAGLVFAFDPKEEFSVNERANKIGSSVLSIDSFGNGVLDLGSYSKQTITIQNIKIGESDFVFNETFSNRLRKQFYLTDLDEFCAKKSRNSLEKVVVQYIAQGGIVASEEIFVKIKCVKRLNLNKYNNLVGLGAGTETDPWVINSCKELQGINDNLGGNYLLAGDIDCSETKGWNGGEGFVPIGDQSTPFSGKFDGQNKEIMNLFISRPLEDGVGLFGAVNSDGRVFDLGLADANITGGDFVGGFFGIAYRGGDPKNIDDLFLSGDFISVTATSGNGCGGYIVGIENGSFSGINLVEPQSPPFLFFGTASPVGC